jgi:hypothetical protein
VYPIERSGGGRTCGRKMRNDRVPNTNIQEREKYKNG